MLSKLKRFLPLFLLIVVLAACQPPVPIMPQAAAESPASTPAPVEVAEPVASSDQGMIQPNQVSIDTQGLPYSWNASLIPTAPYDASQPPGSTGLPEHIQINFGVVDPADKQPGDPIMYIIPVDDYVQMWNDANNPYVADSIDSIYKWTVALQSPPPTSGLPALPPEEVVGVNDLAVQIDRAASDAESASKSGYRFVGRWAQGPNPVTSDVPLRYTYQGFTNDGKYLVSFLYPVTTASLPKQADLSAEEMDKFYADPQAYIQAQAEMLNALSTADWSPDLATLDQLIGSLRIEDMPATGLQGPTWQWIGSTYQGEDTPVDDPTLYELVYGVDGSLSIKADCNLAAGTYTTDDGMVGGIRTQLGPTTLAECGPDSRSQELINSLAAVQDFRVQPGGSELKLNMPAGGPVLNFKAAE